MPLVLVLDNNIKPVTKEKLRMLSRFPGRLLLLRNAMKIDHMTSGPKKKICHRDEP